MELNEFLSKFKEQYIDSYDSLTGMAILVMIKDNFNIDITDEDYKNLRTVREVYNYIQDMKK